MLMNYVKPYYVALSGGFHMLTLMGNFDTNYCIWNRDFWSLFDVIGDGDFNKAFV